jgi:PAS domain S-box-containing protein
MPDVSVQTAEKYPHTNFYAALTGRGKNGVVIVTPDGKIEYANENAEQLLGLKRDLITEHYYHDRDPWHQIDRERNTIPVEALPLSIALQQKTNVRAFEHGIILPNGEIRWLSVSASPIHASDGNLISAVASFEDISHRIT